jgi:oligopeptide transport system substrate-binding protein
MVPPGIPGRSDADFLPTLDPAGARELLAAAGYPGGRGFPSVVLLGGGPEDRAFAAEIQRELGVTVNVELQGDGFFDRLEQDPPQIFSMGWVADYPGPNDFLGILLGSGASNNYGRWSSPAFDEAIGDALKTRDPAAARAAFDRAEVIVRDEAPTIPLTYDVEWSLARTGLLGAYANGLGIIRMAGLAWRS